MNFGSSTDRFDLYIEKANRYLAHAEFLSQAAYVYHDALVVWLFYVAVQLTNAHQYRHTGDWFKSHGEAKSVLDPQTRRPSAQAWSLAAYASYDSLQILSRVARYLASKPLVAYEPIGATEGDVWEAMQNLEVVLDYFISKYPAALLAHVHIQTSLATRPLAHLHQSA